jgi:serine protease Do
MKNTFAAALLAPLLVVAVPVLMTPDAQAQTAQALPDFADLAEKAGPAVVNIRTTARVAPSAGALPFPDIDENDPMYEFFRRFFPNPPQQGPRQGPPGQGQGPGPRRDVPRGLGSGFILSADGYVLTNAHVVEGADDITVTLTDRREFKGKVIGADRRTDVALVAIGSPFGLENTVTAGIVSTKARETGEFLPFIQTDVAVNPGNSGGPLLNMRGEVIGINSQIFTTSGGYNGISFAIPIDEAMNVQQQLRSSGRVIRGRIGVGIEGVSKEIAEAIGLGAPPRGALVNSVEKDGPAAKAGLEPGDVILRFDGKAIERSSDLPRIVGGTKPGTSSTVTVFRKGAQRDLKVQVAEMPQDRPRNARATEPPKPATPANALGLGVSDVPADKLKELGLRGGVQVDVVDGLAAAAGLRAGDIITQMNSAEVQNARQFNEAVAKLDPKKDVAVLVRRGEASRFVIIRR